MVADIDSATLSVRRLSEIVAPIAARYHITAVYLFGSRARGDNRDDSDYDFIVEVTPEYDWDDHMDFISDISKALGKEVDVITRRSLKDNIFTSTVLEEMVHVC